MIRRADSAPRISDHESRDSRQSWKEKPLRRAITITLWMALLVILLLAARAPLEYVHTIVRIYREELRPPLQIPVAGVRSRALSGSWGAPRGGGRRHEGIDIFAPCGRVVVSATEA